MFEESKESFSASTSLRGLSVDDLKTKIPLLRQIKQDDFRLETLLQLLKDMTSVVYESSRKYELMFKVIKVGNLFEILCSHIKGNTTAEVAKACENRIELARLEPNQQFSLFQLARNVSADYFHAMDERSVQDFFSAFKQLCCGESSSVKLSKIDSMFRKISKGSRLKKVLGDKNQGEARIGKLFCQMSYFLKKTNEYLKANDHEAAIMALIAAGNCGRNFNFSGLNQKKNRIRHFSII